MKALFLIAILVAATTVKAAPVDFGWPMVRIRSNFEATGFLKLKLKLVRADSFYHYSGKFVLDGTKDGELYNWSSVGMLQQYRDSDNTIQDDYRVLPIKN